MFSVLAKTQSPRSQNSSGLKSVSGKLRFRDGLAWTVGLTGKIKLRFQILSGEVWTRPYSCSEDVFGTRSNAMQFNAIV